jgi:hypothetical protein
MNRPNFFIVGSPRCGTTALYTYLQDHPQVFMSTPKEPWYFSSTAMAEAAYLDLFAEGSGAKAIGEGSTNYIFVSGALEKVKAFAPDARILAVVRNPLEAVPSLHSHNHWTGTENVDDITRAWDLQAARADGKSLPPKASANHGQLASFLQYSDAQMHGRNLERAFSIFPREQVKVIVFDDIKESPRDVYASVLAHLGLDFHERTKFGVKNEALSHGSGPSLSKVLMNSPVVAPVKALARAVGLGNRDYTRKIASKFANKNGKAQIDQDFRAKLRDHFRADVRLLERIIDRDLGHWGF